MAKPILTPQQFVDEVNSRLPGHAMYQPGMRVFLVPVGSDQPTGTDFEGPGPAQGVTADVENHVRSEYDVVPALRR